MKPASPLTDRAFRIRWTLANAVAEGAGLGTVFAIGWAAFSRMGEPADWAARLGVAGVAVLLGAFEGWVVGWAQAVVLQARLPELSRRSWVAATVVGAAVAWALGMLPSTLLGGGGEESAAGPEISQALTYVFAILLGAVAGPLLAWTQVLVLRRHAPRAWRWIPANALAWALGMPVIFVGADLAAREGPAALRAAALLACIVLAGAVVGAVHGAGMVRILRERDRP